MMRLILFLLVGFSLCGCGYHFAGETDQLPGGIRNLYVELFDNQTREAFLENQVTNRVIEKFARTGKIDIVEDPGKADGILSGVISSYGRDAVAYDQGDSIVEYRSRIGCTAELRKAGDRSVLWKGTVFWDQEYSSSDDRGAEEDAEAFAQEAVAKRLADELYSRMTENF